MPQECDPQEVMRSIRWNVDKTLLIKSRGQPLIARRLLGPRWHLTMDKLAVGSDITGKDPMLLTITDYKKKAGIM